MMNRREFLTTMTFLAAMALYGGPKRALSIPMGRPISLDECISTSPEDMAESSPLVQESWSYIVSVAGRVKNVDLREKLTDIWLDPTPRFFHAYTAEDRSKVRKELKKLGLVDEGWDFPPPLARYSTRVAPGSGYEAHHSYPGGLVVHTAENIAISFGILEAYSRVLGIENLDRDVVLAAQMLHDIQKPWVFQWQEDGSSRKEAKLCDTGEHHVLGLAESLWRGFPAAVVVAQACAHQHPGDPEGEKRVVRWIEAACLIAGVDPVHRGVLERNGNVLTLPRPVPMECWIVYLGDHDWVLTNYAAKQAIDVIKKIAPSVYGLGAEGRGFNSLRNFIFSRLSQMRFWSLCVTYGVNEVEKIMLQLVHP